MEFPDFHSVSFSVGPALLVASLACTCASLLRLDRGARRRWWWVRLAGWTSRLRLMAPGILCIAVLSGQFVQSSPFLLAFAAALGITQAWHFDLSVQRFIQHELDQREMEMKHWQLREPAEQRLAHQASLRKQELDRVQDVVLRRLMDPHFLFNALNGIMHDMIQREWSRALRHLKAFNRLAERQIHSGQEGWITLHDQWESLQDYIELEIRRLDRPILWSLSPLEAHIAGRAIPSLLLQPLVENALWHGLGGTASKSEGKVQISAVSQGPGHVAVEVRNTPFENQRLPTDPVRPEREVPRRRHATDLIRHRLNLLDRLGPSGLTIEHTPLWTVARIVIPCRQREPREPG